MSAFTNRDVVFDEKSETEDKAQSGASDSSADTQEKEFKFSKSPKRPVGSEEYSDLDGDEQKAT